ncbi:MAG: L,D-transpeptidase [Pseudomonadota bacterium]
MITKFTRRSAISAGVAAAAAAWAQPASASTKQNYRVPTELMPRMVTVREDFRPGEIHVDPYRYWLYWVTGEGIAIRYAVGVARASLYEPGTYTIGAKREWPSWRPTDEMIEREPHKYKKFEEGVPGGPDNPLGARALYLFEGRRDTYLRIHGTPQPWTIGSSRSNGCVRLVNGHVKHLYDLVPKGATVVLHG